MARETKSGKGEKEPFGATEMRLSARQWLAALGILLAVILATPAIWERAERFDTGAIYRIPYELSRDYWLYARWIKKVAVPGNVIVVGDSVVWGEYVRPEGTLPTFLNQQNLPGIQFVNGGVNGLFPLALEGMLSHYARFPAGQKILLHCNLLWLTSPEADLSSTKEEHFNHSRLVPQFSPRIPSYRADPHERISATIENRVPFLAWTNHLQSAYFEQKSISTWSLADDGADPPHYPHVRSNPLSQITLSVPQGPADDPLRGPESSRHKPWSTTGVGTTRFEWIGLDASLQWAAFQRIVRLLRERGIDVFVVVGPFNEHILAPENRPPYLSIRDGVAAWLAHENIPHSTPDPLPTLLYADASHPLTAGYEQLATHIATDPAFRQWIEK
jgi:hypothetical protein